MISKKEDEIEDLKEALSLPRQHYKFIENMQAEEILKQKDEIISEMALNMGVPEEKLLSIMYKAEAAREAKNQVDKALKEEADGNNDDVVVAAGEEVGASPTPQSPSASDNGGVSPP